MGKSKPTQKPTKVTSVGSVVKKKKSETMSKCVYNNKEKIQSLSEEVTTELRDMEEFVNRGEQICACPYYASRESVKYAQVPNINMIIYINMYIIYFVFIDCNFTIQYIVT